MGEAGGTRAAGVRLTPVGMEAAVRARAVLAAMVDLERTLRDKGRLLDGQLRLGIIPTIAPYLLPGCSRRWRRIIPGWRSPCAKA